ncbi:hypothetical protein DFP73DRAFT_525660 [Morchella snyderi]|nr:hypothetical protein DFP73DRAFT_525660 [Morchella snyderi]
MKFYSVLLFLGFLTALTIQAPLQCIEKRGENYLSPIFRRPSMLSGLTNHVDETPLDLDLSEGYGLDGGSDRDRDRDRATVFPKAIPSAPWPFGRGFQPVWEGPRNFLDPNPEWSLCEEKLDTPPGSPFPKPISGEGAWAPLGSVGDLVDSMPIAEDDGIAEYELACPNCGRKPSAWEKLVKWFKGAWKKVTGIFKKKDKTAIVT